MSNGLRQQAADLRGQTVLVGIVESAAFVVTRPQFASLGNSLSKEN
jgi:hypothetical protein